MRTTTYQRGDVLFAEIVFSGSIGRKNRPVVVLSVDSFHQAGSKLIVATLTSNILPPFRPGHTFINDWASAGLAKPSAMRGIVITIDQSEVVRPFGVMSPNDFAGVENAIKTSMGF
jgi:mRNA-degrading endonuclease toxin of MazEF toxin-antitoxin module